MDPATITWTIVEKRAEAQQVETLVLEPTRERPTFTAGQYLTVLLPGHEPAEGKLYSISSAPYEPQLTLTIKQMGKFSQALLELPVGGHLTTTAPYGFFYPEADDEGSLVFLAGGIGITPIYSIIKQLVHDEDQRPLHLHYSNQTEADIVFAKGIKSLQTKSDNLHVAHYLTREPAAIPQFQMHHMTADDILSPLPDPATATFFLCGSTDFTRGLWQTLRDAAIAPAQIYTEGFF